MPSYARVSVDETRAPRPWPPMMVPAPVHLASRLIERALFGNAMGRWGSLPRLCDLVLGDPTAASSARGLCPRKALRKWVLLLGLERLCGECGRAARGFLHARSSGGVVIDVAGCDRPSNCPTTLPMPWDPPQLAWQRPHLSPQQTDEGSPPGRQWPRGLPSIVRSPVRPRQRPVDRIGLWCLTSAAQPRGGQTR